MSLFWPLSVIALRLQQGNLSFVLTSRVLTLKALDHVAEGLHILKTLVNGSKTDIGNLVQPAQFPHHPLTNQAAGYLHLFHVADFLQQAADSALFSSARSMPLRNFSSENASRAPFDLMILGAFNSGDS